MLLTDYKEKHVFTEWSSKSCFLNSYRRNVQRTMTFFKKTVHGRILNFRFCGLEVENEENTTQEANYIDIYLYAYE